MTSREEAAPSHTHLTHWPRPSDGDHTGHRPSHGKNRVFCYEAPMKKCRFEVVDEAPRASIAGPLPSSGSLSPLTFPPHLWDREVLRGPPGSYFPEETSRQQALSKCWFRECINRLTNIFLGLPKRLDSFLGPKATGNKSSETVVPGRVPGRKGVSDSCNRILRRSKHQGITRM